MVTPFTVLIALGTAAIAVWAFWRLVTGKPVILKQLLWAGVLEALLGMQLIVAGVLLAMGVTVGETVTLWGYLITILFILPVAAGWAFADRTKWSSAVLLTATLTVGVLQWRLVDIWTA